MTSSSIDWARLRAIPTPEIIHAKTVTDADGAGALWHADRTSVIELSALGAMAWDGRDDKPSDLRNEWAGVNLLCNAAPTPFVLDGERYASVDSFYEALKLPERADERALCAMSPSSAAKRIARRYRQPEFSYRGIRIPVGSVGHEALLAAAITAKIDQHPDVEAALLATGSAKLVFPSRGAAAPGVLARVTPMTLMLERWKRSP